jgi:hypothetical protein
LWSVRWFAPWKNSSGALQDGLKLDLNRLARNGFIKPGANIGLRGITRTHSYWGDVATGMISADMSGNDQAWFRIQLGSALSLRRNV